MSLCFSSYDEAYRAMFTEYPDVVTTEEAAKMLNVGRKRIYKLVDERKLHRLDHIAKGFLITKQSIVAYVLKNSEETSA